MSVRTKLPTANQTFVDIIRGPTDNSIWEVRNQSAHWYNITKIDYEFIWRVCSQTLGKVTRPLIIRGMGCKRSKQEWSAGDSKETWEDTKFFWTSRSFRPF
jgi:hypothetical protein